MPELPEVETTANGLKPKVLNRAFVGLWTDTPKIIKNSDFEKTIKNRKILKVWRRAKNIVIDLTGGYSILVHQKMTGHLLFGKWELKDKKWEPVEKGPLDDPMNRFIHVVFFLDNGAMIALSDLRKFAKIELWKTHELIKEFKNMGPEPLDKDFTFEKFKAIMKKKKGKIKQVLMDQNVIAGIGNIYSSEALWQAKIHPLKDVSELSDEELSKLYKAIKKVLILGIKLGGESFSDYRKPDGRKGDFDSERKAYRREGQKCKRCGNIIKRIKVGQRSAFFCPYCQKL